MKAAIMQPYIFPYIGYFQMVNAVDTFVIYDDVNFIKRGWINRNRILLNNKDYFITVPCSKISQNKTIRETEVDYSSKEYAKLLTTISLSYKKAVQFPNVFPLIEEVLAPRSKSIADLAEKSIVLISEYLGIETKFIKSSDRFSESKGLEKSERLMNICANLNATDYINAEGGIAIYSKTVFKERGVNLHFIKPKQIKYKQFGNEFLPWLSIIDVLMFNSVEDVKLMLEQFELV